MRSRRPGIALAVAALGVAIALFVLLRDDDDGSQPGATTTTTAAERPGGEGAGSTGEAEDASQPRKPRVARIVVRGGEPVGGVQELTFTKGEAIEFRVSSDVAEEVHLHGYDVSKDVAARGSVSFDVPATIDGVFEVELEHSAVPLAEVTVDP